MIRVFIFDFSEALSPLVYKIKIEKAHRRLILN